MGLLSLGLLYFTQVSVDGTYVSDLLPGFLLIGVGLGFSFVPVSIAALAGIQQHEAGLASGLINTSQQIGGALGLAVLATVATSHTKDLLGSGTQPPEALTSGFTRAFWVGAAVAFVALVTTLIMLRRDELERAAAQAAAAPTPAS